MLVDCDYCATKLLVVRRSLKLLARLVGDAWSEAFMAVEALLLAGTPSMVGKLSDQPQRSSSGFPEFTLAVEQAL